MIIARYTANASGVVPAFNNGYQYTVNETVSDGIYTVEISSDSDFSSCSFNGKSNLLTVECLKVTNKVTSMKNMFNSCNQLTQLDMSNWDTSNVTDMSNMFYACRKFIQLDLSNWDTSSVTTMKSMFNTCTSLTQLDASNWDISNVKVMDYMFSSCSQLTQLDVSNWNMGRVFNMTDMFYYCISLNNVIATNVSTSTLSKLVGQLPTKKSDSYGDIRATNSTEEIISSANAKYWNIYDIVNCRLRFMNTNKKLGRIKSGKGNVHIITTHKRKM